MRVRRLRKQPAQLEITAFLNLIVVLVPFLLSTAVFSHLAVLELTLPAQSSAFNNLKEGLQLEVVIRGDALEVGDRYGGLIQRLENTPDGYDIPSLSNLVQRIKAKFPDTKEATVLSDPNIPYDVLVHVMDALRTGYVAEEGGGVVRAELFPKISLGDAPVRKGR